MDKIMHLIPENKRHLLADMKQFQHDLFHGTFQINELDGKMLFPGFKAETTKYARDEWNGMKENDVYVISYPKTGTNWMMEIVAKLIIIDHPNEEMTLKYLPVPLQAFEMGPVAKFDLMDSIPMARRVFMSHLDADTFPVDKVIGKGCKIIQTIRNPKDQAVSWFHFTNKVVRAKEVKPLFPSEWQDWSKMYFSGQQPTFVGKDEWYPEYLLTWRKYKVSKNILFLYYEDMIKDLKTEVKKVADFLEINASEEDVCRVAEECTFAAMKNRTQGDDISTMDEVRKNVMRTGKVGGWKNLFTVAQSEEIDQEMKEKLGNTDIKFTYELD